MRSSGTGASPGFRRWSLRDRFYPQAQFVHVAHALTDELDRWRRDPNQANRHALTPNGPWCRGPIWPSG
jgi:hypothetical protein